MPSASKVIAASLLCAFVPSSLAAVYTSTDTYIGPSFLTGFVHEAIGDPTHGRVQYISQSEAQSLNLTYTNSDTLILKSDSKTVLSASGPGRKSIRLLSKKQYSTHVSVFNVRHMPVGCGTWPAYNGHLLSSTQTTSSTVNGNQGCGVASNKASSYGPNLNAAGGGWYAMERTSDIKTPGSNVDPSKWGTPYANFVNNNCDLNTKFGPNNYIINLTFCGDWAGNQYVYPASCPQSCVNHVNTNPGAFANAYWDIAALRIYQ